MDIFNGLLYGNVGKLSEEDKTARNILIMADIVPDEAIKYLKFFLEESESIGFLELMKNKLVQF